MLSIYTDGSCLGNRNVAHQFCPSGWGVVVVEGENPLFEKNGVVVIDSTSSDYIGAEVGSNNTAELTGIHEGINWIVAHLVSFDLCEAKDIPEYNLCIFSDSEYALKSILGVYNGSKNRFLINNIRQKYQMLQRNIHPHGLLVSFPRPDFHDQSLNESETRFFKIKQLSLEYVKGHSGQRWNDRADTLAVMAAQNNLID